MKKNLFLSLLAGLFLYISLSSYSTGYPDNKTGSSGDTAGCGGYGCHSNVATTGVVVSIILDSAGSVVTRYTPGYTYRLKISGINTLSFNLPYYGFQVSAFKGSGAASTQAGSFSGLPVGSVAATYGALSIVSHTSPFTATGGGVTGALDTFSMNWTAPAAGTGTINITALLNMVTGDAYESADDKWNLVTVSYPEGSIASSTASIQQSVFSVSPNPATDALQIELFNSPQPAYYSIFSLSGKLESTGPITGKLAKLDISNLAAGTFLITIQSGLEQYSTLVLKH